MKRMRWIGLAVIAGVLQTATADVYLKQRVVSPDDQGKPVEQIQEVWITPTRVRTDGGDHTMLFDLDKKVMVMIDHAKKKYMEMPLDFSAEGSSEEGGFPAFMQEMMKVEVTITPTSEEKKINNWNCRKYLKKMKMMMGTTEGEVWASEEIRLPEETYKKFQAAMMASQPGLSKALQDALKEMEKIKGVGVYEKSTTRIMGREMTTVSELLEVKEAEAPATLFVVPSGYKKEKFKAE